ARRFAAGECSLSGCILLGCGREGVPGVCVWERRAIPSPVGGRFLSREECFLRRMPLAFGRERVPRDGVSERRAIPSPVGGRFLLREECFLASAANQLPEPERPRGGACRAGEPVHPAEVSAHCLENNSC